MKRSTYSWVQPVFFLLVLGTGFLFSYSLHRDKGYFNWKSEIWADRAGNYIFLPATFYYHWDLKQCPPKMDERTGYGFVYDHDKGKIRTESSYGPALLLSPFFVAVHFITRINGIPQDWGFAPIYHRMVDVAALVYMVLGLFLLYRLLRKYFGELVSCLSALFLLAGTNLFYYSIGDTLMPHVYNFFLASLYILFLKKYLDEPGKYLYFLISSLALALIILIRPLSFLLVLLVVLLDVNNRAELQARARLFLNYRHLPVILVIIFMVYLPKFVYNHYAYGHYIIITGNETYANLFMPRLPELWFSTLNGLFLYTPLMTLVIAGMILMIKRKAANAWIGVIIFVLLSFALASRTCWYTGCSFSQRSLVDFLPVFAIPFAFLIGDVISVNKKILTGFITFLLLLFSWYNISLARNYEECFFGSTWDWNQYANLLYKAGISPVKPGYGYKNDYENMAASNGALTTELIARSGNHSLLFDQNHEFNSYFSEYPGNMGGGSAISKLRMKLYVFKTNSSATGALLICEINKDGQRLFYESRPLDVPASSARQWFAVPVNFDIPKNTDPWSELKVYIWNKSKTTFYIDDLEIFPE